MEEERLNAEGYRLLAETFEQATVRASGVILAQRKEIERLTSLVIGMKDTVEAARLRVAHLTHDLLLTQDIAGRYEDALRDIASGDDTSTVKGAVAIASYALRGAQNHDIRESSLQPASAPTRSGGRERSTCGAVEG